MKRKKRYLALSLVALAAMVLPALLYILHGKEQETSPFRYPDRNIYALKGDVKSVTHLFCKNGKEMQRYNILFDINGAATTDRYNIICDQETGTQILRGENREIRQYILQDKKENCTIVSFYYKYNEKGLPVEINSVWYGDTPVKEELVYDSNGYLLEKNSSITTDIQTTREHTTYIYTAFDSRGNWTERECIMFTEELLNGAMQVIDTQEHIEKREILYY